MIADVAFDVPVAHPFSYRIPDGWTLEAGQRVAAPLRGASRVGVVTAVRDAPAEDLKPLLRIVDAAPLLSPEALDLARWIAAESLTSFGSTCLALLPPPARQGGAWPAAGPIAAGAGAPPELLTGAGRETRLLAELEASAGPALVLGPDVETASRWAERLMKTGTVVRLDSGVPDPERAAAWAALVEGSARLAVGTRSALLTPLPPGARLVLLDEHEAAHRPPGPPRMHSREIVLERARREPLRAVLTSATPSAEVWWGARQGQVRVRAERSGRWPAVRVVDARGIARREALTPALARAIRETLAAGRRVALVVSRLASALGCDECGAILKCARCLIALAYSPAGRTLACRLCAASVALPDTCAACRGRRLTPFGWSAERVEHAVRRRFARARIARWDADGPRRARATRAPAEAFDADILIGTRQALRLVPPASLGLAGFVSPDQLLAVPDFRAAERAFALLWAAAERVRPDGAVIVQSQNPSHYALDALARRDLEAFYEPELRFRAESGYPPFRRLALITTSAEEAATAARLADAIVGALGSASGLLVYPPVADRRGRGRRIVVKGGAELPHLLAAALGEFHDRAGRTSRARNRGIIDIEVDPVEWPF